MSVLRSRLLPRPAAGNGRSPAVCPGPRGRGGRAGFTLVELMVVLALIGVMTALILPEMRGTYSDAVLRAGGRDLISVCSIAASRAVSFNRVHRVHIDARSRKFQVERRAGRGPAGEQFVAVRDVAGCNGELDERLSIRLRSSPLDAAGPGTEAVGSDVGATESGDSPAVTFYPDGTADGVDLLLRDREGFRLVLRVNPITARVGIVRDAEVAR